MPVRPDGELLWVLAQLSDDPERLLCAPEHFTALLSKGKTTIVSFLHTNPSAAKLSQKTWRNYRLLF